MRNTAIERIVQVHISHGFLCPSKLLPAWEEAVSSANFMVHAYRIGNGPAPTLAQISHLTSRRCTRGLCRHVASQSISCIKNSKHSGASISKHAGHSECVQPRADYVYSWRRSEHQARWACSSQLLGAERRAPFQLTVLSQLVCGWVVITVLPLLPTCKDAASLGCCHSLNRFPGIWSAPAAPARPSRCVE